MKVNNIVSFCTHFVEDSFSHESWRKRPKEIEDSSSIPVQKSHKEIKGRLHISKYYTNYVCLLKDASSLRPSIPQMRKRSKDASFGFRIQSPKEKKGLSPKQGKIPKESKDTCSLVSISESKGPISKDEGTGYLQIIL